MSRPCGLVVDSGAVLPAAREGVRVVPLRIELGGEVLRDGVDISHEQFYARQAAGEAPHTSTPSPGEYLEAFRDMEADTIVCLTIPAGLSAMHESATLAARMLADQGDHRVVHVVDTGSAAAGFGLVARAAAELCAGAAPADEVLERVEGARQDVRMWGTLSTLTHLARSGRVPHIAAGAAGLLNVRPVFELSHGDARRVALARGGRRALRSLVDAGVGAFAESGPLWVLVVHSAAPDLAAELRQQLHAHLQVGRSELCALPTVMGAYTGPGMTGFAAMPLRGGELLVP